MKRNYNTFDAASWLLENEEDEETLDTTVPETETETEDSDEDTESTETEETTTEEPEEEEDTDGEVDDSLVDAGELADDTSIEGRLDTIETKLDDLLGQKQADPAAEDEYYDLDLSNPICPHCGARLNIVDDSAETNDIDDQIIDGDFDTEDETDVEPEDGEDGETFGEEISVMDDNQDTTQDLNVGDDDYVNFDEIMASITDDDDENK